MIDVSIAGFRWSLTRFGENEAQGNAIRLLLANENRAATAHSGFGAESRRSIGAHARFARTFCSLPHDEALAFINLLGQAFGFESPSGGSRSGDTKTRVVR